MFKVITVLTFVISIAAGANNDWWQNTVRLHQYLLQQRNYSAKVAPQPEYNRTVKVHFTLAVRSLHLDDHTQTLIFNSWVFMYWRDNRLTWDNKDYGKITYTEFGAHEVWTPDLTVYNSADPTNLQHYGDVPTLTYSGGITLWVPPMTTHTECPMDLTYWPFDTQHCTIYLGSWTKHGFQVDFFPLEPNKTTEEFLTTMIKTSHHWRVMAVKLERHSTVYDCCPEPYITLTVDIFMTRASPSFGNTVLVPALAVALLTLVQFALPVQYTPRVTVGVVTALMSLIMLVHLDIILPPLGETCPLIVKYYAMTLLLTVLSVAGSGVLARLAQERPEAFSFPPPAFIKTLLTGPLGTVLCVGTMASQVGRCSSADKDADDEGETLAARGASYQHEWLLLASAFDRIVFITYAAVFVFALIAFTSTLH